MTQLYVALHPSTKLGATGGGKAGKGTRPKKATAESAIANPSFAEDAANCTQLAIEARHRLAGVVCALAAENVGNSLRTAAMRWRTSDNSRAPHGAALVNCRQITTCDITSDQVTVGADRRKPVPDSFLLENMPIGVIDGLKRPAVWDHCQPLGSIAEKSTSDPEKLDLGPNAHPLCCDCEPCLNGDHDHG